MTIKAATYGAGRANLNRALSEHLPFTTSGALRGAAHSSNYTPESGRLNDAERAQLRHDTENGGITYVVWSYGTPIAWVRGDGSVYKVAQKFTATTSKHQGHLYQM